MSVHELGLRCDRVRTELVHYHFGEVEPAIAEAMGRHVETCDGCAQELEALRTTLDMTQGFRAPALPEEVRERLWARVEARRGGAMEAMWSVFSPMLLGVGTCLLSLYPLHHFDVLRRIETSTLVLAAVVWASLYNSVFTSILHHARLRRLLAPDPGEGRVPVGEVDEPEETRGIRIQSVIYGLLVAFTGLFWAAMVVVGPGATRGPGTGVAPAMTSLSLGVLGMVGLGIGVHERSHAYATSILVSSLYCALGTPALYLITHGAMSPADVLRGSGSILFFCLAGTAVGRVIQAAPRAVASVPLGRHT